MLKQRTNQANLNGQTQNSYAKLLKFALLLLNRFKKVLALRPYCVTYACKWTISGQSHLLDTQDLVAPMFRPT